MKATYEDIPSKQGNESFLAYAFTVPSFKFKWHYHPEYELTLITHGNGRRLVGDSNESFESGDIALLGPGLPHTWSSNALNKKKVSAVVIQFSEDFINNFIHLNGFDKISGLLASASRGLFFPNSKHIAEQLIALPNASGVEKVTSLITILQQLSTHEQIKLSSEYFTAIKGEKTENRLNNVCQFIQKNFKAGITLEQAAGLIHLSNSAFSKFFKRATGKTFSDYVNDIRIGNACQQLTKSDKTIAEIAFGSGFESLTYFNRIFLKKKGTTPRGFRTALKTKIT
ncbi:MAG: AraC family transcriptional regulator [Cyclobacteriaceae bacterium]